jgi:hypothetical protein
MNQEIDAFVESTVEKFTLDRDKSELRVDVSCVFGDQKRRTIVARGIDSLILDDLGACNIIDRVILFAPEDAIEEANQCTSELIYLMQKRELSKSDFAWPAFTDKLALIRSGKLRLMTVEAVAGASGVVLARDITFE